MKRLYNRLLATSDARFLQFYIPFVLVALGILSVMLEVAISGSTSGLWLNLGTELAGAAMTYVLLTLLIKPAEEQEEAERKAEELKQELILEVKRGVTDVAVFAVDKLRDGGWLTDGSLNSEDLVGANLQGANLRLAELQGAKLVNTNLQGAHLSGANLRGVRMEAANLQEAELVVADLRGARLEMADLRGAILFKAKLQETHMSFAGLRGANLFTANLQGADLSYADLKKANLREANLQGADLSEADLKLVNLWDAKFDNDTTLPDRTKWTPDTDMAQFNDPAHTKFWRSDDHRSHAYKGYDHEAPEA